MATEVIPSSEQARISLTAISPRFAMSIFLNNEKPYVFGEKSPN
jgi:hypothetical protein